MMETTSSKRRKITRASTNYFLIGNSIDAIPHNKLQTLGTVLRHVLYLKKTDKPNTSIYSYLRSAAEVLLIWSKGGVKTITQNNAVQQLTKIWNNWKVLNKSKTRRKDTKFQKLFNIHNLNKLSQHHRNILVVNVTYACPTLFSLPNPY